jgi:hypothetical protein
LTRIGVLEFLEYKRKRVKQIIRRPKGGGLFGSYERGIKEIFQLGRFFESSFQTHWKNTIFPIQKKRTLR